jgi:predicted 3-demethylubiquinone-9 3-methyltransferase (glyoxalase superfamily)
MQKITPHLWYDNQAKEAAHFYTSVFPDSTINHINTLHNTPSGDCDIVGFELAGQSFMAISAGPIFKFNPSISFLVACKTKEEVDAYWKKLADGGKVLMALDQYPFSERYGWTEDKYGLSWQVMHFGDQPIKQLITPVFLFSGDVYGKAEDAIHYYTSIFKNSKIDDIMRYTKGEEPNKEGTVKYGDFSLEGQQFGAMDTGMDMKFSFNEAVSLLVQCETQQEIDYFWKMSAVPEAEQCGWIKDQYGVSWQISPSIMGKFMTDKDERKVARVTEAFLQMKKFNIAELERAYNGETVPLQ